MKLTDVTAAWRAAGKLADYPADTTVSKCECGETRISLNDWTDEWKNHLLTCPVAGLQEDSDPLAGYDIPDLP